VVIMIPVALRFRSAFLASALSVLMAAALQGAGQAPPIPTDDPLAPVRARFAPDTRLAVFDLTIEQTADAVVVRGEVESAAARDAALDAVRASAGPRLVDKIAVLPDPALGAERYGIVRVSVANVRGRPAHSSEMVTQTIMGWPVRVLKQQGGWYLVHTEPEGYLGWIEELQLTRVSAASRDAWESAPLVIVTAPTAVVREAQDVAANPVTDLVIGALLRATGDRAGPWTAVILPDGRRGFVRRDDVDVHARWRASRAPVASAIERTARQFMGAPYLWGGTSAKGFDCSGLTKMVFHLHGIVLPRDADQQGDMGADVPIDEGLTRVQPGDLLFFGTAAKDGKPENISHVAIHIGNLEFIHASGLVRQNSLDPESPIYSDSLRKRLLRVRRVLPVRDMTSTDTTYGQH
jgi:gamma-D-glutamyl-L-lysine dipeptidyl-peptidase